MKTLILYATKFGSVAECAETLAGKIPGEKTILDAGRFTPPLPDGFDRIIIGCSVHAGKIQRSIIKYVEKNLPILEKKELAVFMCSLDSGEKGLEILKAALPETFMRSLKASGFFGGTVTFSKMNFIYRGMMKKITGRQEDYSTVDPEKIDAFAREVTA